MKDWLRTLGAQYVQELAIFTFALVARLGYWAFQGTIIPNDLPSYFRTCSVWWTNPAGIVSMRKGILYAGTTLPMCSVVSLPGATATWWVTIQILLSALVTVLIYRIGVLEIGQRGALLAALGSVALWDTFQWAIMPGSDTVFTFALVVTLWAFARYKQEQTLRRRLTLFVSMGYLATVRPFGFPIVVAWLMFDFITVKYPDRVTLVPYRIVPTGLILGTIAAIPAIAERRSMVDLWTRGVIIGFDYFYEYSATGSDSLLGFVIGNLPHIVVMGILRALLFFAPFVPRHSTLHAVINVVTYLPILLIGVVGIYDVARNRFDLLREWVAPIVVVLGITAITFVSYDFRYRGPVGPLFALLGAYAVINRFSTTEVANFVKQPLLQVIQLER